MMAFTKTNMELPRSFNITYLHGLHHSCCLSRPYLARHFFGFVISAKKKKMKIKYFIIFLFLCWMFILNNWHLPSPKLSFDFFMAVTIKIEWLERKQHIVQTWHSKLQSKHFVFEVARPLAFTLGNSLEKSRFILV